MSLSLPSTSSTTKTKELGRLERIGVHSHVRGLGEGEGLVGQKGARKAASIITKMLKERRGVVAGKAVLIAGLPGTGKTAIALAMARSLGQEVPFISHTASELMSPLTMSKTEALMQALRKSIGIRISETVEVIEGEVVEIIFERSSSEDIDVKGKLTLKTTDMETVYELGPRMIDSLGRERITSGDIIKIQKETGKITRLGRSLSRARDFDSTSQDFIPCPEGELQQLKEEVHVVSLHEIDLVNSATGGTGLGSSLLSLFSSASGPSEIRGEIRDAVNGMMESWREEGKADIIPGVLFIDEVHMLDLECFSFLNRAMEEPWAPLIAMASNKGLSPIRDECDDGIKVEAPHGIPTDFLDRLLIIATESYSKEDLMNILKTRAVEVDVSIEEDAMEALTLHGYQSSLRYAMQLLLTSYFISQRMNNSKVTKADVERAFLLFLDEGRSCEK